MQSGPTRRETSIPRSPDQIVEREEYRITEVPDEDTTGTPIPAQHPEQSGIRRTATFATVQSVASSSSSSSSSFYDGPEVTERLEVQRSDSAERKHTSEQEELSPREDSKFADQVAHEQGLGREFPSVASRPKRSTSVDLGEFSRRSQREPVS